MPTRWKRCSDKRLRNVVDSAQKARRLLDEVSADHLQVVIDGANLFHAGELPRMRTWWTGRVGAMPCP